MYTPQDNQIKAWIAAYLGDPAGGIGTLRVGSLETLPAEDPIATNRNVHVHEIAASGRLCEHAPLPSPRE